MKGEVVIDIFGDGAAQSLHSDELPLMHVLDGDVAVERASSIVYQNDTKLWEVVLAGQKGSLSFARGFAKYNMAIAFEIEWLQGCRKEGVDPSSTRGMVLGHEAKEYVTSNNITAERSG